MTYIKENDKYFSTEEIDIDGMISNINFEIAEAQAKITALTEKLNTLNTLKNS